MQEKVFNNGDVMIRQGENDPFFYQIISGSADVFVTDDAEKQIHLATLKEGAYFGEMALLEGGIPHSATVIAAEDNTRVLEIPGDQIPQYYKEQPEKIYELMKYIGSRIRSMTETYENALETIDRLREKFFAKQSGKAERGGSSLFGNEKDDSFKSKYEETVSGQCRYAAEQ